MKTKTLILLLALQLITVAASIHSINRLESQTRDTQDKQFKAELENVELKFKLQKIELDKKRNQPLFYL